MKLYALALMIAAVAWGGPRFDIDRIPVDRSSPQIGAEIDYITESKWFIAFEDLPPAVADWDYNDYAGFLTITQSDFIWEAIEGISAHTHKHSIKSDGDTVTVKLHDLTSGDKWYTGTEQAWVECVSGCQPSAVPEPATMLLSGLGLTGLVWWRRKTRKRRGLASLLEL